MEQPGSSVHYLMAINKLANKQNCTFPFQVGAGPLNQSKASLLWCLSNYFNFSFFKGRHHVTHNCNWKSAPNEGFYFHTKAQWIMRFSLDDPRSTTFYSLEPHIKKNKNRFSIWQEFRHFIHQRHIVSRMKCAGFKHTSPDHWVKSTLIIQMS